MSLNFAGGEREGGQDGWKGCCNPGKNLLMFSLTIICVADLLTVEDFLRSTLSTGWPSIRSYRFIILLLSARYSNDSNISNSKYEASQGGYKKTSLLPLSRIMKTKYFNGFPLPREGCWNQG